ncbi:MAG: hypothetical protein ACKOZU_09810 [Planctomycetaceae bacterium]
MRRPTMLLALGGLLAAGCAHHANQYAFAPPLAPPVYPQPQAAAQPVVSPAPGPVVAAPVGAVVAGAPVVAAVGEIPANPDGACPPCTGAAGATPVCYDGPVQTQPCPPGP